jgi:penicillin-binding protein 1A
MSKYARQRRARRRRNPLLAGLSAIGMVVGLLTLSLGVYVLGVASGAPPIDQLQAIDKGTSSVIYAADGSRLGFIQSDEARTPVSLDEIPDSMQEATVAIEDARFYHHNGIDLNGIARAAIRNIEAGKTVEGGSTITMQLVRNLFITDPKRDLARKIREAKLATEVEAKHSKEWILEQYLNSASYGTVQGRTAVGVEAASQTYFSKGASSLALKEAALIAGLTQSPTLYNPFLNPSAALERRNEVLEKMAEQGYITPAKAEAAYQTSLGLNKGDRYTSIREPYFFDFVEQQLIEKYGTNVVRRGGLEIQTTIDPRLQEAGRASIDSALPYSTDPSSAVVSIDPTTGYIKAMASSGSYEHEQYNLAAQGHRQPGSAFKTFVLTTAIREGINPATTSYVSKPLDLKLDEYGPWKVETYGGDYAGKIDLVRATLRSDNTVFAQLDLDLGPKAVRETAYSMGIETKLDGLPAEGLGGLRLGVSPLEMANAYATLASGGIRNKPIAITEVKFPDGRKEDLGKPERTRVFSDAVAYEVTKILKQNVTSGTGTRAGTGCTGEAGKTGTTDNFNDAWFAGYTPKLATSVWVGYPDALREMRSVHGISVAGGTFPAQIWHGVMTIANGIYPCSDFPEPKSEIEWIPFYGEYAEEAQKYVPPVIQIQKIRVKKGNSAGGGGFRGYDPRLYAPGVQGAPQTQKPSVEIDPPQQPGQVTGILGGGGGNP